MSECGSDYDDDDDGETGNDNDDECGIDYEGNDVDAGNDIEDGEDYDPFECPDHNSPDPDYDPFECPDHNNPDPDYNPFECPDHNNPDPDYDPFECPDHNSNGGSNPSPPDGEMDVDLPPPGYNLPIEDPLIPDWAKDPMLDEEMEDDAGGWDPGENGNDKGECNSGIDPRSEGDNDIEDEVGDESDSEEEQGEINEDLGSEGEKEQDEEVLEETTEQSELESLIQEDTEEVNEETEELPEEEIFDGNDLDFDYPENNPEINSNEETENTEEEQPIAEVSQDQKAEEVSSSVSNENSEGDQKTITIQELGQEQQLERSNSEIDGKTSEPTESWPSEEEMQIEILTEETEQIFGADQTQEQEQDNQEAYEELTEAVEELYKDQQIEELEQHLEQIDEEIEQIEQEIQPHTEGYEGNANKMEGWLYGDTVPTQEKAEEEGLTEEIEQLINESQEREPTQEQEKDQEELSGVVDNILFNQQIDELEQEVEQTGQEIEQLEQVMEQEEQVESTHTEGFKGNAKKLDYEGNEAPTEKKVEELVLTEGSEQIIEEYQEQEQEQMQEQQQEQKHNQKSQKMNAKKMEVVTDKEELENYNPNEVIHQLRGEYGQEQKIKQKTKTKHRNKKHNAKKIEVYVYEKENLEEKQETLEEKAQKEVNSEREEEKEIQEQEEVQEKLSNQQESTTEEEEYKSLKEQYHKETGGRAIYAGKETKGFQEWKEQQELEEEQEEETQQEIITQGVKTKKKEEGWRVKEPQLTYVYTYDYANQMDIIQEVYEDYWSEWAAELEEWISKRDRSEKTKTDLLRKLYKYRRNWYYYQLREQLVEQLRKFHSKNPRQNNKSETEKPLREQISFLTQELNNIDSKESLLFPKFKAIQDEYYKSQDHKDKNIENHEDSATNWKDILKQNLYKSIELKLTEKSKIIKILEKVNLTEDEQKELVSLLSNLSIKELNELLGLKFKLHTQDYVIWGGDYSKAVIRIILKDFIKLNNQDLESSIKKIDFEINNVQKEKDRIRSEIFHQLIKEIVNNLIFLTENEKIILYKIITKENVNETNKRTLFEKIKTYETESTNLHKIYMMINLENGKLYIGYTSSSFKKRKEEHFANPTNRHIEKAFEKYGVKKFVIVEIHEKLKIESQEEAKEREKFWIDCLNTRNRTIGYNKRKGGEGGNCKRIEFELKKQIQKKFQRENHPTKSIIVINQKLKSLNKQKVKYIQLYRDLLLKQVIKKINFLTEEEKTILYNVIQKRNVTEKQKEKLIAKIRNIETDSSNLYQVYMLINTENGKIYVGQSIQFLNKRLREHFKDPPNKHLENAFEKYGRDKFVIVEIQQEEKIRTENELNEREKFWIKYLIARNPRLGYNIREGGTGGGFSDDSRRYLSISHVKKEDLEKLIKGGISGEDICKKLQIKDYYDLNKAIKKFWGILGVDSLTKVRDYFHLVYTINKKDVDKKILKNLIIKGINRDKICKEIGVKSYVTLQNKIKEYWGDKGINGLKDAREYYQVQSLKRNSIKNFQVNERIKTFLKQAIRRKTTAEEICQKFGFENIYSLNKTLKYFWGDKGINNLTKARTYFNNS